MITDYHSKYLASEILMQYLVYHRPTRALMIKGW